MNIRFSHAALLALLIAVALVAGRWVMEPRMMVSYGQAQIGGHFSLTDTTGKRVSEQDYAGKLMLVYMGYSHCPDICPATLAMLSDSLKKLGSDASRVTVVFISLDKEDTPQILGEYLKAFDPRIVGLTGNEEEIQSVVRLYKAFSKPAENAAPGNRQITHSGLLYLMDTHGHYIRHFENGATSDTVVKAVRDQAS